MKKQETIAGSLELRFGNQILLLLISTIGLLGAPGHIRTVHKNFKQSMWAACHYEQIVNEDEALKEIWTLGNNIYKKTVEFVALYYCKQMFIQGDLLYNQMILDISRDAFCLLKLLALYVPMIYNNPTISSFAKMRKLSLAASVALICVLWIKTYYQDRLVKESVKH